MKSNAKTQLSTEKLFISAKELFKKGRDTLDKIQVPTHAKQIKSRIDEILSIQKKLEQKKLKTPNTPVYKPDTLYKINELQQQLDTFEKTDRGFRDELRVTEVKVTSARQRYDSQFTQKKESAASDIKLYCKNLESTQKKIEKHENDFMLFQQSTTEFLTLCFEEARPMLNDLTTDTPNLITPVNTKLAEQQLAKTSTSTSQEKNTLEKQVATLEIEVNQLKQQLAIMQEQLQKLTAVYSKHSIQPTAKPPFSLF